MARNFKFEVLFAWSVIITIIARIEDTFSIYIMKLLYVYIFLRITINENTAVLSKNFLVLQLDFMRANN